MLSRIDFSAALLPRVQQFDCGSQTWEKEVSDWIKGSLGSGGALDDMANLNTAVWLYEEKNGELVGFGSLGQHQLRYADPKKGKLTPMHVIPFLGLARSFWGKPTGPPQDRYSREIMRDILDEARKHPSGLRAVYLCVHEKNVHAIDLYKEFNFAEHSGVTRSSGTYLHPHGWAVVSGRSFYSRTWINFTRATLDTSTARVA